MIILEDRYLYRRAIGSASAICIEGLASRFVPFAETVEETENRVRNERTLVAFDALARFLFTRTSAVSISLIKSSLMKISRRYRQHLLHREAKVAAFSRVKRLSRLRVLGLN